MLVCSISRYTIKSRYTIRTLFVLLISLLVSLPALPIQAVPDMVMPASGVQPQHHSQATSHLVMESLIIDEVTKVRPQGDTSDDHFGNAVALSGDIALVGSWRNDERRRDSGAAYLFGRNVGGPDNWGLVAKLIPNDGGTNDRFGISVALSGDVALVGAYRDDNNGRDAGAAYLFGRNVGGPDNWGQITKLTPQDGVAGDSFGWSVSLDGGVALIGSYNDEEDNNSGAVYLFGRNVGGPDNWGQITKITPGDGATENLFGHSVTVNGDIALVGAREDNDNGTNAGAAYLFGRNVGGTDNWGQIIKITASDGASGDNFGQSVSLEGDVALIGTPAHNSAGAAYLFGRNVGGPDNWGQLAKLTASDGRTGDNFGRTVAVNGNRILIGSHGDDEQGSASGSAYLFGQDVGGTDNWGLITKLVPNDGMTADFFGYSVALAGEVALISAILDDDRGAQSGSAYLFGQNIDGIDNWGQITKVYPSGGNNATRDWFGSSVSLSGDVALIGVPRDDDKGVDAGAAYLFGRNVGGPDNWGQITKLTASDGSADDGFGGAVSLEGDVALVGARDDDDHGTDSGAVYLFGRNVGGPDNWGLITKLTASDGSAGGKFGASLTQQGDTLLVGARGAAYLFGRNIGGTDNWGQITKFTGSSGSQFVFFGRSVALNGDLVLIGGVNTAHLFDRNEGGPDNWGLITQLVPNDNPSDYGSAVALEGDVALVGDPSSDAAYLFERNTGGVDNWGQQKKLIPGDDVRGIDDFGGALTLSGNMALIGAPLRAVESGAAFLFGRNERGSNNWGLLAKLNASDSSGDERFGNSVAMEGNVILIGMPFDSDRGPLSGAAYFFSLIGGNQAPTAIDDTYSTDEDVPLNVAVPGVLGNDNDPNGDPLTAALASGPSNGTLTLNLDGSFVYTPTVGFNGTDSFTYQANDGTDNSNVATVTLTVNPTSSCGVLSQEAENGTLSGSFVVNNDNTASNGQYIHVSNGTANRFNGPDNNQSASYCVQVETAGTYRLKGWVYAVTGLDNSFYVQVNNSPTSGYLWDFSKNTEYQQDYVSHRNGADPVEFNLSAGEHTITFFLREDGARLDKWELQLVDQSPPPACGELSVEAEAGQLSGSFVIGNDATASGGQYIHVPEGIGNSFNKPDSKQLAEYCFQVDTPGTYHIKGNVYAASGMDNSFFVQVDDNPNDGYLWDLVKNTRYATDWVSNRNGADPVEVELTAGTHTVSIFLREDGARLDRLELELVSQALARPTEPSTQSVILARGIVGSLLLNDSMVQSAMGTEELTSAGITVTLVDAETRGQHYRETTQTDAIGQYYFDQMPVGDYLLTVELPAEYGAVQTVEALITTSETEMVDHSLQLRFNTERGMDKQLFLPLIRH